MNAYENNILKKEFTDGMPGHVKQAQYFYFDENSNEKENRQLSILCGGYEKCANDFELNRENFPFYTIKFTIAGKGLFTCNGRSHALHYGTLTGFGPQTPHHYKTDPNVPMEHIFIIFRGEEAKELLQKSTLNLHYTISVNNPDLVFSLMRQILKIGFEKTAFSEQIIANYLRAVLLEQAKTSFDDISSSPSLESFLRCKNHLDQRFEKITSSNQLAEECCLDIRYIARLFKRYKQVRPHEYLMQLKMNKAANLLLTSTLNIKQISKIAGIDDPYHFSRIFKKKFKVAPTEYRKSFF